MKLEISNRKASGKSPNIWKLNNSWIKEEIKEEIRKYFVLNENENTTHQNLWDATKAILWRRFIALNACIRKEGWS